MTVEQVLGNIEILKKASIELFEEHQEHATKTLTILAASPIDQAQFEATCQVYSAFLKDSLSGFKCLDSLLLYRRLLPGALELARQLLSIDQEHSLLVAARERTVNLHT